MQTDHKSLEMTMKKSLQASPRRFQRMLMQLQRYCLDVKYEKGRELVLADTLSRAHLAQTGEIIG